MLTKTYASAVHGVDARTITVEVHAGGNVAAGGNQYFLVGLPDNVVREGWRRIHSAMHNVGYRIPRVRLIANLAPADIKKEGSAYDLPIALAIAAGVDYITEKSLEGLMIMGELALDGAIRPVKGVLPIAIQAKQAGFRGIIVPQGNAKEAAIVKGLDVYGIETLKQAIRFLQGQEQVTPEVCQTADLFDYSQNGYAEDFSDVRGQENIKRALEIAAAGGHNVILIGPPGAGKTMLARRLPTILPRLSLREALETTKIHSVAGLLPEESPLITTRPFRSPHHTISDVAMVGGGSNPSPGEISLAHNGVLFIDEMPEFKRSVLEVLRQPMEQRKVTISRARVSVDYPAGFMLVASMNPCPCGFYNHPEKDCVCAPGSIARYLNRISGPLLDRIDLHVEVTPVSYDELSSIPKSSETSEVIRERVAGARQRQEKRFQSSGTFYCNAQMPGHIVREVCTLDKASLTLLKTAMERLQLSARAYDRILKVARTIADLAASEKILAEHLAEAINFRTLDRGDWAG